MKVSDSKRINLVCIKDGWILEKMARLLSDALPYIDWTERPTYEHPITYYINYHQTTQTGGKKASPIELALFTHIEEWDSDLIDIWEKSAKRMDVCITMSKLYQKRLKKLGIKSKTIPMGVELDEFPLKKIKIGVVGSVKGNRRKGEDILKEVIGLEGIEWRLTGGSGWPVPSRRLKDDQIPSFIRDLDYLLIPSHFEGGPIPAIEALASGTPVISAEVGWMPELPHIKFRNGDAQSLRKVLEKLILEKQRLRESVKDRTWQNYVQEHDKLFRQLLK